MFVIHPIIQSLAILLGIYVLYLGTGRFRFLHLHQKTVFPWKRHVVLGIICLIAWLGGMLGGMLVVRRAWGVMLQSGPHAQFALCMVPLILFGLISGLFMNSRKKKRTVLPLLHGINNVLLLILALNQARTGWPFLKALVFVPG
jgi:hypothetical protein